MAKKIKPLFKKEDFVNADGYSTNPFIQTLEIKVNKFKDGNYKEINGEKKYLEHELEAKHYTKVFTSVETRLLKMGFAGLTTCKLYIFIEEELEPAQDYIWINQDRFLDEINISDVRSYQKAIQELCEKHIIYPTHLNLKNVFWINPSILFSGNRIHKYPKQCV